MNPRCKLKRSKNKEDRIPVLVRLELLTWTTFVLFINDVMHYSGSKFRPLHLHKQCFTTSGMDTGVSDI